MKLHLASDLHLDLASDKGISIVNKFPGGADVLVLAGDIHNFGHSYWPIEIFKILTVKYPNIVFVTGNHEFYGTSPAKVAETVALIEKTFPTVHYLKYGEPVVINGQRFVGDTLWFRNDPLNQLYENLLSDFRQIKSFNPWVYDTCEKAIKGFIANLQEGDVLITHHLPTSLSIHPKYKGEQSNRFFLCDISELILERKPALALHGHTHERVNGLLGETRVLANPMGYKSEFTNIDFWDQLNIEL